MWESFEGKQGHFSELHFISFFCPNFKRTFSRLLLQLLHRHLIILTPHWPTLPAHGAAASVYSSLDVYALLLLMHMPNIRCLCFADANAICPSIDACVLLLSMDISNIRCLCFAAVNGYIQH
jgi:hypothetical protein